MNIQDLKIIINQVKKNITCPKCKGKYIDDDLELIGNVGEDHIFFHANCHSCEADSVINVSIHNDEDMPIRKRLGTAPRMEHISSNEVLDMHNFLKNFDGDFVKMFKK